MTSTSTTQNTDTETQPRSVLRMLPLSVLRVQPGFNPRTQIVRDDAFTALVATIRSRGVLTPIRVRPADENGEFAIIAGHRRHAAAIEAVATELPAIIDAAAGPDVQAEDLLVDAVIENDVRVDLNPLQRAQALRRMLDHGHTIKGVAEQLGRSQRHVRTTLLVLELPDEVAEHVAAGLVPQKAIPTLVQLAKIHPGLATGAAARVLAGIGNPDAETWDDLITDPLWVAHTDRLPDGVFDSAEPAALAGLALSEKAVRDLAAITRYRGTEPTHVPLNTPAALQQAQALGALHVSGNAWTKLIIGEDVRLQLIHDAIAADARACRRRLREDAKAVRDSTAAAATGAPNPNGEAAGPAGSTAEELEQQQQAQAAAEREEARKQRVAATAFNEQLGAAVVNTLSRVKLDERALKILTAIDVARDLDMVAARGARYGFPGWTLQSETKTGQAKTGYLEKREAGEKAREYLAGATKPGEIAGRTIALLVMACLADEAAVAQSSRTHFTLTASGMPWAGDVDSLLDELAAEQLPQSLVKTRLVARAEARRQTQEREQARQDARVRVSEQQDRLSELTDEELANFETDLETAYGRYGAWQQEAAVREKKRRAQPTEEQAAA